MHHANRAQRRAEEAAGRISATCRPSPRIRMLALAKHGPKMAANIHTMVEDATAIAALAKILDQAMTDCVTADGRVDMKDVAARVILVMRENQR